MTGMHLIALIVRKMNFWSQRAKRAKVVLKTAHLASLIQRDRQSAVHALTASILNGRLASKFATQHPIMIGVQLRA